MFFFFNDTASTEISPLSLHDALPNAARDAQEHRPERRARPDLRDARAAARRRPGRGQRGTRKGGRRHAGARSEEHTSELQSRQYLVCRLLLEKKKRKIILYTTAEQHT